MSTIGNDILEQLNDDLVSHGWLVQCVKQDNTAGDEPLHLRVMSVLEELLGSGHVEIGTTNLRTPDYLEFIAWKGTIEERLARATEAVQRTSGPDKEFAYWLCLRKNVDRFEGEGGE